MEGIYQGKCDERKCHEIFSGSGEVDAVTGGLYNGRPIFLLLEWIEVITRLTDGIRWHC